MVIVIKHVSLPEGNRNTFYSNHKQVSVVQVTGKGKVSPSIL